MEIAKKEIELVDQASTEVERLIEMLDKYIEVSKSQPSIVFGMDRGAQAEARLKFFRDKSQNLQEIGDAMTFANPLVWLLYKRRAYVREDRREVNGGIEIDTLNALIDHCSSDGICAKRFHFINRKWSEKYGKVLLEYILEQGHSGDMDLEALSTLQEYIELSQKVVETAEWGIFEYFKEDGVVKKWGNYSKDN